MRKKTKMILSTVFCASALALAGGALMSANTLPASAAATPVMKIKGANLAIEDNVHILFALSLENVTAENVDLLVWKETPTAYTEGTQLHTIDYGGATVDSLPVYTYDKLALKEMTQEVYVCAHTEVSGVDYYSEPIKYSILEYAYNKLGKTEATPTTDANLIATLNEMLQFGAAMQTYKNHNVDKLATDDFTYVRLAGGAKFTDGFDYGLFEVGSTVEIVGDTTDEMYNKACFEKTSGGATLTVPESILVPTEQAPDSKTYTISEYPAGTQYAKGEEHWLDAFVTVTTTQCHFTDQLYIYSSNAHNGYAIISSPTAIAGISLNAGNGADTLNIYGSNDGETWTTDPIAAITTTTSYADYSVIFTEQYKYLKLDVAGTKQVRIANFTIFWKADSINLNDVANRTSWSATQQIWEQNGITITNNQGTGNDIAGELPLRVYKNSEVIISYNKNIKKIIFTCNTTTHATALGESLNSTEAQLGEVTVSGKVVTLVLTTPASSVTFTPTAAIWIDSLIITYNA